MLTPSVVNILTDVLFATLPVPIVWNLQVNMRTKISLLTILSLGYLYVVFSLPSLSLSLTTPSACACSIVKTVYQVHVFADPDSTRNDSYFIWNSVERTSSFPLSHSPPKHPRQTPTNSVSLQSTSVSSPRPSPLYALSSAASWTQPARSARK